MPRTFGRNQVHISQVVGWVRGRLSARGGPAGAPTAIDDRIAALVAERIPNRATIQTGIGVDPERDPDRARVDHRDLGVHTELISDGVMDLVERGVVTGVAKQLNRTKTVGTFALGTQALYDFLDENAAFELWPVRYVNDPRVIAQEANFVSINATHRRRPARPVRVGDGRRRVLLVERGQADFARGRDVLRGTGRASSCCTRRPRAGRLEDRRPARPRVTSSRR